MPAPTCQPNQGSAKTASKCFTARRCCARPDTAATSSSSVSRVRARPRGHGDDPRASVHTVHYYHPIPALCGRIRTRALRRRAVPEVPFSARRRRLTQLMSGLTTSGDPRDRAGLASGPSTTPRLLKERRQFVRPVGRSMHSRTVSPSWPPRCAVRCSCAVATLTSGSRRCCAGALMPSWRAPSGQALRVEGCRPWAARRRPQKR